MKGSDDYGVIEGSLEKKSPAVIYYSMPSDRIKVCTIVLVHMRHNVGRIDVGVYLWTNLPLLPLGPLGHKVRQGVSGGSIPWRVGALFKGTCPIREEEALNANCDIRVMKAV